MEEQNKTKEKKHEKSKFPTSVGSHKKKIESICNKRKLLLYKFDSTNLFESPLLHDLQLIQVRSEV